MATLDVRNKGSNVECSSLDTLGQRNSLRGTYNPEVNKVLGEWVVQHCVLDSQTVLLLVGVQLDDQLGHIWTKMSSSSVTTMCTFSGLRVAITVCPPVHSTGQYEHKESYSPTNLQ